MKAKKQNDQVAPSETAEILRLAQQCLELNGDFVELGCYRGDTSVLLGKLLAQSSTQLKKTSQNPSSCGKTVQNSEKTMDNLCKKSINRCKNCAKTSTSCAKAVENRKITVEDKEENSVEKRLWIYDSFAGLPEKTAEDSSGAGCNFQKGGLFVTKREVVDKIRRAGLHNVIIKKAWFDDLEDGDLPAQIAFAFLDGDLYESIKTSLRLVLPRLNHQGIIIVHDYNNPELPGSSRAVDEFLRNHTSYKLTVRRTLAIIQLSH